MFEYLKGSFAEITPTHIVVDCGGVGYIANISLNTFEELKDKKEGKVFIHLSISENNQSLYGFSKESERGLFRALVSVSGVGPSTARMILSSQSTNDIIHAIIQGNLSLLKTIKGIGPKTAQRLIVELQDKLSKQNPLDMSNMNMSAALSLNNEALLALEALGFNKNQSAKAVGKVLESNPSVSVEDLIKQALKIL
jgi:Holliday junction DNA helicase RuvA